MDIRAITSKSQPAILNLFNSQGRVHHKTEVFDDKITGIHLYESVREDRSDIWCIADFSGSAGLVKIRDGNILAQQNFYLEATSLTVAKPSYTCSVLVQVDVEWRTLKRCFYAGLKVGSS